MSMDIAGRDVDKTPTARPFRFRYARCSGIRAHMKSCWTGFAAI